MWENLMSYVSTSQNLVKVFVYFSCTTTVNKFLYSPNVVWGDKVNQAAYNPFPGDRTQISDSQLLGKSKKN